MAPPPQKHSAQEDEEDEEEGPEALDGGYGWVIVAAAFLIHLIADGASFGYGVISHHIKDYYGASESEATLVGSLQLGCYLLSCPVSGKLIERFGYKAVCITGSLLATIGFCTSPLCTNIGTLMITYGVIAGVGFGMMYLASISAVTMYFERRRVMATGVATMGSGIGMFCFSAICGYLIELYDWKSAVLILGGIAFNGCVLGMLLRPLEDNPKNRRRARGRIVSSSSSSEDLVDIVDDLKTKDHLNGTKNILSDIIRNGDVNDLEANKKVPQPLTKMPNPKILQLKEQKLEFIGSLDSVVSSLQHIENKQNSMMEQEEGSHSERSIGKGRRCINAVIDTSLVKEPIFYIICAANVFTFLGAFIPLKFQVDRAVTFPLSSSDTETKEMAEFLVSISGIANTLGRATSALFDLNRNINKLIIYNLTVVGAGISCFFNVFSVSYPLMCAFSTVFTYLFGMYISLSSVVTCELLGPDAVNNAFALMCMLRGLANIAGGPIAGAAYDALHDYDVCFYIGGAMMTIGGLCFCTLLLPVIQRRSFKNKNAANKAYPFTSMLHISVPIVRSRTSSISGRSRTSSQIIKSRSSSMILDYKQPTLVKYKVTQSLGSLNHINNIE